MIGAVGKRKCRMSNLSLHETAPSKSQLEDMRCMCGHGGRVTRQRVCTSIEAGGRRES